MDKKCNIVLLTTIDRVSGCIAIDAMTDKAQLVFNNCEHNDYKYHHIYITSDEKAEVDDYGLSALNEVVLIVKLYDKSLYKKIIATTDTLLGLPLISQQFIKYFIVEYNKGNVITKVKVEYEVNYKISCNETVVDCNKYKTNNANCEGCIKANYKLKINPDNIINIKQIKNNWDRKEVSNLLIRAMGDAVKNDRTLNHISIAKFSINWIEENL